MEPNQPVVLYCKTFSRDLDRVKILVESIKKHNIAHIPLYVSVPQGELKMFQNTLAPFDLSYLTILSDQDIFNENLAESWKNQQVIKMMFWKSVNCENYVVLDSDSYFIKDFRRADFLVDDITPYTVMHEQKDLFTWTTRQIPSLGFDPKKSFGECREPIQELFDRKGRLYDFGPVPVIWSRKVWETLEEEYVVPNGLNFAGLINSIPSEFSWYGEWLLTRKPIPLWPIEPIFKVFHYLQQYHSFKITGYTENEWANNYLGVVMQSSSGLPLKY
jgi:hypothetical protein